jgi:hypothetical protein
MGLIESRLRTVTDTHQRQIGFMPVSGCSTISSHLTNASHMPRKMEQYLAGFKSLPKSSIQSHMRLSDER